MGHYLLLAVLLHVWLVLLLGNAPGGTARQGEGVWGAVNITLRGPETAGVAERAAPPAPTGPTGDATQPRWGGAVRDAHTPPAPAEPGAAQLGTWAPTAAANPTAEPAPPPPPGRVLDERPSPPAPAAAAVAALPMTAPTTGPAGAAATAALPALAPALAAPPPVERLLPTARWRDNTPVRDSTPLPRQVPLPAAPLPPAEPITAMPALTAPVVAPFSRMPQPAPSLPSLPATPTATAQAPAAAPTDVSTAEPIHAPTAAPTDAPIEAPPEAPIQVPTTTAPALRRLVAPPLPALAAPTAALPRLPVASAAVPTAPALPSVPPLPALSAAPSAVPAAAVPSVRVGAPDAGNQRGQDVASPAAAAASAPPRLNLQLARPRGGELSRFSTPGALPLLPRPPDVDEKLGRAIQKAAKADCRSAYRSAGVLAVLPLATEALRNDGGCRW